MVIVASATILITNFVFANEFDLSFLLSSFSSVFIIIAMVLSIRANKNQ